MLSFDSIFCFFASTIPLVMKILLNHRFSPPILFFVKSENINAVAILFIGVELFYTAGAVSAVQQSESVVCVRISRFLDFLPI